MIATVLVCGILLIPSLAILMTLWDVLDGARFADDIEGRE